MRDTNTFSFETFSVNNLTIMGAAFLKYEELVRFGGLNKTLHKK